MRMLGRLGLMAIAIGLPIAVSAQLLPGVPIGQQLPGLPSVGGVVRGVDQTLDNVSALPRAVTRLAQDRLARIDALLRAHPDAIALDDRGDPARAREVVVTDPDAALIDRASEAGFALIEQATIDGVDIGYARFHTPPGKSLPAALKAMRKLAGKRAVSADQLHFESGIVKGGAARADSPNPFPEGEGPGRSLPRLGIIDGGVGANAGLAGSITRAGFAKGTGGGSDHGTAIASLLVGTPSIHGAAPGAPLWAADVYGTDPAGGNAVAIARALGWMVREQVPLVVVSLVGPPNPLLDRVVGAARAKGTLVVAAVGNDGPAAPPAYPASYPGVVAVTGVDGKDRALIEAGRATHLDYAAPGADMLAADAQGRSVKVRGTSFAAPLAAAVIARRYRQPNAVMISAALRATDATARDLGPRGPDKRYGRGLVCGDCRTPAR